MANCVTCPSIPLPPCSCSADEECIRIGQSCTDCARNICQAVPGRDGGKTDIGPTVGGAIGGALAGTVVVVLLWFFWRRRRSPLSAFGAQARHSRRLSANEKGEPAPSADRASRALSQPLEIRSTSGRLSKRLSSPPEEDEMEAANRVGDDPFSDNHASIATSDWSFRSSHSTRIIPIVHIPDDSPSMSVEDGQQRTPLGEKRNTQQLAQPLTEAAATAALASQGIGRKASKSKPKAKPAPMRPTRRASLDLVLPAASPKSPVSPALLPLPPSPDLNGPTPTDSRFSSSTWATSYNGPRDSRFDSTLAAPAGPRAGGSRALSTVSTTFSDASSHMSYILDQPHLVTPSSAERITVGTSTARRVQLSNPTTPLPRPSTAPEQPTTAKSLTEDPFSDAASVESDIDREMLSSKLTSRLSKPSPLSGRPSTAPHASLVPTPARNNEVLGAPGVARASLAPSEAGTRIASMASISALDGIPFVSSGESSPLTGVPPGGSLDFALLPPRMPAAFSDAASRPTSEASLARSSAAWTTGPQSVLVDTRPSSSASAVGISAAVSTWSLATGPSSASRPDSVATDLPERRSGFASVLNDVPFHLAFPGDRDSMATERLSRFDIAADRASMASESAATPPPPPPLPPVPAVLPGAAAVKEQEARASTASLALSAQLAAQLSGDEEAK